MYYFSDTSPDLADSQDSKSEKDTVGAKPEFIEPLRDYEFTDGKSALLKCVLKTSDDTDVVWYKNGRELPDNSEFAQKFDGTEAILDILEVFPEDAGTYVCEAANDHGISTTECKVTILGEALYMYYYKIVETGHRESVTYMLNTIVVCSF